MCQSDGLSMYLMKFDFETDFEFIFMIILAKLFPLKWTNDHFGLTQ